MHTPYNPIHSVKWLEKYLKTNYYKKKYDRFMWWRSFTPKSPPLGKNHSLRDKIANGDFDIGPFVYEIELVEHKLNERYIRLFDDPGRLRAEEQMDKARHKRLQEDRDKDEARKLQDLRKAFMNEFRITGEQYDKEVVKYTGPDLLNFYFRMEDKYNQGSVRLRPVPKFR
jgi:hypothetical protein